MAKTGVRFDQGR